MSVMSTSGRSRRSAASAVSACSNAVGDMPPWRKARSRTQRMEASSSTSQTLSGLIVCNMEWQQDGEDGSTGPALKLNEPVVSAHKILRHCKTKSGPIRAARDQRIEQSIPQRFGHTGPVVLELHTRDQAVSPCADVHVRECPRTQHDRAMPPRQCLHGVASEIQHRLNDL